MGTRVIILGWHFKNNIKFYVKDDQDKKIWNSEVIKKMDSNDYIIGEFDDNPIEFEIKGNKYKIYLFAHPKDNANNMGSINNSIKEVIENNSNSEILIYLHEDPWKSDTDFTINNTKVVVHIKSGGGSPIYGDGGILNYRNKDFMNPILYALPWDAVWDKFYLSLAKIKNELIQLWLPLAIDIQGLCEVNEKLTNKYLNEFKNNYSSELVSKLVSESKQYIDEIKELFKKKLESDLDKLENLINAIKNYELNKQKNNCLKPNGILYLPNWLQKLSKLFDDMEKL